MIMRRQYRKSRRDFVLGYTPNPQPLAESLAINALTSLRHELARQLASEDGLPWRLAEEAISETGRESSEVAWTTSDFDRLRATAAGAARLARALAQGEVKKCVRLTADGDCLSPVMFMEERKKSLSRVFFIFL